VEWAYVAQWSRSIKNKEKLQICMISSQQYPISGPSFCRTLWLSKIILWIPSTYLKSMVTIYWSDIGEFYLRGDRLRLHQFIYKQLLRCWIHLPHSGHFIQPYRVHLLPILVIQWRKQRHIRRFEHKACKAQVSWLEKQPKLIKNRRFKF
jgi:hypothetical protein